MATGGAVCSGGSGGGKVAFLGPWRGASDKWAANFAGGFLFAKAGTAAEFTRLFVVLVGPKLFLHAAALDQFLKAAQGGTNRFFVVDTHS
jgi:hypothetical protein